jgi:hypothetical protein
MEEIRDVIDTIVRGCATGGVKVPDVLAAFVARTTLEKNQEAFVLDSAPTPESTREIILQSIEKLLERDNPALETMKMQVEYDKSFIGEEQKAQQAVRLRNKMVAAHKMSIVDVEIADGNDFEALTTLYRKIFRFLLDFVSPSKGEDKVLEREVAAALESVFPRIGLKAFAMLSYEEKNAQLMELARIILGIRLFNKDQGRGGAGISNLTNDAFVLSTELTKELSGETEAFQDACSRYEKAIVNANRLARKAIREEQMKAEAAAAKDEDDKSSQFGFNTVGQGSQEKVIIRWSEELTNRRQYNSFLQTLQEEMFLHSSKVTQLHENIAAELANIKKLVSDKNSVSKEVIYPRFDSLGTAWLSLLEESHFLHARNQTFMALGQFRLSFHPSLTESKYAELTSVADDSEDLASEAKDLGLSGLALAKGEGDGASAKDEGAIAPSSTPSAKADSAAAESKAESKAEPAGPADGVVIMNIHENPEFMQLPLELQGYCAWTMYHNKGLLIPGKPALGIVRWDNMYFVCDHAVALREMAADPRFYYDAIRQRCMERPEYIHLLRMQRAFPKQSIARLLESPEFDPSAGGGSATKVDASTGTPTHFIESRIEINYHWNEWELRRRALKAANLRKCATSAQQTDNSHFKRDSDTQVFMPKESETQTRKDRGTAPPVTTSYIQGLRGKQPDDRKNIARVVQLTTDFE